MLEDAPIVGEESETSRAGGTARELPPDAVTGIVMVERSVGQPASDPMS
jgi:hypothetical protein